MKTLLVDDEEKSASTLRTLLMRYCPEVEITGHAQSVAAAVEMINTLSPELVFLDIMMPDGTGFDVLEKCENRNFQVVFVTAFEEYSLRAFRFAALHYLLKPVTAEGLQEAVNRFIKKATPVNGNTLKEQVGIAKNIFAGQLSYNLILSSVDGFEVVRINDIIRMEADSNYTRVYFTNGKTFLASRNLLHFEELLTGSNFVRIHHKSLVNLAHVKKYIKGRGGFVEMSDGSEIEVSARKKDEFLEQIAAYARG